MSEHHIRLVCWSCSNGKDGVVSGPPQFAFQVAGWANDLGMLGVLDLVNSRSLVFCNEKCFKDQMTRRGTLRQRPRPVATNPLPGDHHGT